MCVTMVPHMVMHIFVWKHTYVHHHFAMCVSMCVAMATRMVMCIYFKICITMCIIMVTHMKTHINFKMCGSMCIAMVTHMKTHIHFKMCISMCIVVVMHMETHICFKISISRNNIPYAIIIARDLIIYYNPRSLAKDVISYYYIITSHRIPLETYEYRCNCMSFTPFEQSMFNHFPLNSACMQTETAKKSISSVFLHVKSAWNLSVVHHKISNNKRPSIWCILVLQKSMCFLLNLEAIKGIIIMSEEKFLIICTTHVLMTNYIISHLCKK